jgi:O-antigen ligase
MTARALAPAKPAMSTTMITIAALGLAGAVGLLAALGPMLAVAGLVGMVAVPAAIVKPKAIAHLLVVTIFAEAVTVGGVTVGRLAAPLAVIAVVSQVTGTPVRLRGARPILALVGGYAMIALASLFWTVSVSGTVNALGSLFVSISYMAAFAVLVRTPKDLKALLWTALFASVALAWLWITQYASGVDRRFSRAGDTNFFAAYQVVMLPIAVVLAANLRSAGKRIGIYVALAVIADSVISTLSRGGFATLLVVVMLVTLLPSRFLFPSPREKAAFFTAAVIGLALVLPFAWGDLNHRFQQGFASSNLAGDRGDLWLAAMNGYRQHPVGGLGYGGFVATSFQLLRTTPGVNLADHLRFLHAGEYVHNAYLGTLAELGPLGLFLFAGILGATARALRRVSRAARSAGQPFVRSVANALLVGLIALGLSSLLLSTETSRMLWLVVGLALALPGMLAGREPREGSSSHDRRGPVRRAAGSGFRPAPALIFER